MNMICSYDLSKTRCTVFVGLMIRPWFASKSPGNQFGPIAGVTERILWKMKQLMLFGDRFIAKGLHSG